MLGVMMNLMRTSSLADKVDISLVTAFVSENWDKLFQDGTLDLKPMHDALLAMGKVTSAEVAGLLLFLKKREGKLGVNVKLPMEVQRLPEATREKLLDDVMKIGVQSGVTLVGLQRVKDREALNPLPMPTAPRPAPPPAAPTHRAAGLTERVREILNKDKKDS
jgi:hypothetical protein